MSTSSADVALIDSTMKESVRPLMDLIDDLRKTGVQKELSIPQIAVMGDQSSGKSSVLEAISGIPFPRGAGLVTKCATQLSMSKGSEWSATLRVAGAMDNEGKDDNAITVHNKEDIAPHIKELTENLCGDSTFCHDKYIEVKIIAPDVPDLTIIDLPGIVRTRTEGQSETVVRDVDALLNRYLTLDRTIVLAVVSTGADIATADIIERAAKVDPCGARTMGVLTKPDLVDKGNESQWLAVLANETKPLKHGYVMMKNRSQQDLDNKMTIDEARKSESEYFAQSKYIGNGNRLGAGVLTEALTDLLSSQIHAALPDIRLEINTKLEHAERELLALGEPPPATPGACRAHAGHTPGTRRGDRAHVG